MNSTTGRITDKSDIISLIIEKIEGHDVSTMYIDRLVPENLLHNFQAEDVLNIAYKLGFKVDVCRNKDGYRANGIWVKPSGLLLEQLKSYSNLNTSCCNKCDGRSTGKETKTKGNQYSPMKGLAELFLNYVT
jgi:hypothetical protein